MACELTSTHTLLHLGCTPCESAGNSRQPLLGPFYSWRALRGRGSGTRRVAVESKLDQPVRVRGLAKLTSAGNGAHKDCSLQRRVSCGSRVLSDESISSRNRRSDHDHDEPDMTPGHDGA